MWRLRHGGPCRAPLGLPPQDGGGRTRRRINRPVRAASSAWRRRLAGRAAEKFAWPPRLRVCSLCCVSLSCGSLSRLCWLFFRCRCCCFFPRCSSSRRAATQCKHKASAQTTNAGVGRMGWWRLCPVVCRCVCVCLTVCVLCVRRPERSQPVRLQLEECLSAQQVPTAELIQGYVKKVPPL